jgi:hypothetical protein
MDLNGLLSSMRALKKSIGIGKMMVAFFSAAIVFIV